MKTENREERDITPFSDGHISTGLFGQFSADGGGERSSSSSLAFMDLLAIQDFSSVRSLFDLPPPTPVSLPPGSSGVLNLPATPNEPSISSSSTEAPKDPDPAKGAASEPAADVDDGLGNEKQG